jgi:hypothetical protein
MFTQKTLQDLILHHSLEHQSCSVVVLLQALNQVTERLDNIEALLEKRQKVETYQMKEVKRAMLSKIAGQLNHLEKTHFNTIVRIQVRATSIRGFRLRS